MNTKATTKRKQRDDAWDKLTRVPMDTMEFKTWCTEEQHKEDEAKYGIQSLPWTTRVYNSDTQNIQYEKRGVLENYMRHGIGIPIVESAFFMPTGPTFPSREQARTHRPPNQMYNPTPSWHYGNQQ